MDLSEIAQAADGLAEALCDTNSKGLAGLYADQLRGLKDLATIKALTTAQPVCASVDRLGVERCSLPVGHSGRHQSAGPAPLSWPNDEAVLTSADESLARKLRGAIDAWRRFANNLEEAGVRTGDDTSSAGVMATARTYAVQIEDILKGAGL